MLFQCMLVVPLAKYALQFPYHPSVLAKDRIYFSELVKVGFLFPALAT